MSERVEVGLNMPLARVLAALGVRYDLTGQVVERMAVWMDEEADEALEELVDVVSRLRWKYEQARELQIELPGMEG